MPRYFVIVRETISYQGVIDAADAESAEAHFLEIMREDAFPEYKIDEYYYESEGLLTDRVHELDENGGIK